MIIIVIPCKREFGSYCVFFPSLILAYQAYQLTTMVVKARQAFLAFQAFQLSTALSFSFPFMYNVHRVKAEDFNLLTCTYKYQTRYIVKVSYYDCPHLIFIPAASKICIIKLGFSVVAFLFFFELDAFFVSTKIISLFSSVPVSSVPVYLLLSA